MAVGPVMIF